MRQFALLILLTIIVTENGEIENIKLIKGIIDGFDITS